MYKIKIYDKTTGKCWVEEFYDYELFRKRYYKIEYSKKLINVASDLLRG